MPNKKHKSSKALRHLLERNGFAPTGDRYADLEQCREFMPPKYDRGI